MKKWKEKLESVRVKLFLTLCIAVIVIILLLILINNVVLETFYLYSKQKTLENLYTKINNYYNHPEISMDLNAELEKISINNNFDILIKSNNISIFATNKDFLDAIDQLNTMTSSIMKNDKNNDKVMYRTNKTMMRKVEDLKNGLTYIMYTARLDNNYMLYIRIPIDSIHESVRISNNFLYLIGGFIIVIGGVVVSFISKKFTSPILELNMIAKKMSRLDFSHKYHTSETEDEINTLGKSINTMSDKLEGTIQQLRSTNIELERDIERKSKIDEMRTQFISDVSHELKTPIALIQGYAEGLIENVNTDEENRKFYSEVILDEANKMDKLVKQLLELMKLEYGKREFNNKAFNIQELIQEVIRKSQVMLEEKQIQVEFKNTEPVEVMADEFYIEQIVTNYITNAIKHAEEVERRKVIRITTTIKNRNVRISVFNTGENIKEEDQERIWNRFYKIDSSRNRDAGGTGIGLALVKAIMNNYNKDYGILNKEDGVEFYFELDLAEKQQ